MANKFKRDPQKRVSTRKKTRFTPDAPPPPKPVYMNSKYEEWFEWIVLIGFVAMVFFIGGVILFEAIKLFSL